MENNNNPVNNIGNNGNFVPPVYTASPPNQQYQQPPYTPYTQPQPAVQSTAMRIPPANGADALTALLCILLGIITIDFTFFGGFNFGFTISYILWVILGGVYLLSAKLKPNFMTFFSALSAVALSYTFALYADGFSKFLNVLAIITLSAISLISVSGINKYPDGSFRFIADIVKAIFVMPLGYIGQMFRSLTSKRVVENPEIKNPGPTYAPPATVKRKTSGAVIGGIACAIPVLIFVIPLLMKADAAFDKMIRTIFGDATRLIVSVTFGAVLFILLFSALMAYKYGVAKSSKAATPERSGLISSAGINTFLTVIGVVYLVYLFSQLQYFAGGFAGQLPTGYTYSEYAVRGFFEMCIICVINMTIVFATILLSKRENGKIRRSVAYIELFICIFSLFMVATAIAKMAMYIDCYGMTKLRILTSVFMIMLGLCFVFVAIRLFVTKFPYFKAAVIAVTAIGLVVSFADIDSTIAKYNVSAYQSGMIKEMDVETLGDLSVSAVPEIAKLLDDKDEDIAKDAAYELKNFARRYSYLDSENLLGISRGKIIVSNETDLNDFREYNLTKKRAAAVIKANADRINELLKSTDSDPYDGYNDYDHDSYSDDEYNSEMYEY